MQGTKECYICRQLLNEQGIFKQLTPYNLEEHHIMHGTANRKVSERYGLKVYLCIPHHRTGDNAVHRCRDMDLYLIRKGQQDVLLYIKENAESMCKSRINENKFVMFYGDRIVSKKTGATVKDKEFYLPICSVYGDVVTDYEAMGQCENQMSLADFGIFDDERLLLKTTGCQRTGCVLCGFGCHLEKESRFMRLKETHPKFHDLLHVLKNNGVTYAEAIDWINEHGNMHIKY